jgi:uncharacterized protein YggU (UPF0235/DUF167 family)
MKMLVTVRANSREELVSMGSKGMIVHVKEVAHENKANMAVIRALAKYYKVPRASVKIIHGISGKTKLIEIMGR